jgi:PEP-CTERM motif
VVTFTTWIFLPVRYAVFSFTFPTNGKDFTVGVDAEFSVSAVIADTGQPIDIGGGARGTMSFRFNDGSYFAETGLTAVPEPGTLALMGTGLVSLLEFTRKRHIGGVTLRSGGDSITAHLGLAAKKYANYTTRNWAGYSKTWGARNLARHWLQLHFGCFCPLPSSRTPQFSAL